MSIQKSVGTLLLIVAGCSFAKVVEAQVVGVAKAANQANVRVFLTTYAAEADVIVFKTPFAKNAGGNKGLWYFSTIDGEINKRIWFAPNKENADLLVFYTNNKDEAGWKNGKKRYLME